MAMAVTPNQVLWGHYGGTEGPFFSGAIKYVLPQNPIEADRRLRVITSTEGGAMDAVNMYDSCIVSVGAIQWCEKFYLVSKLLDRVAELVNPSTVLDPLKPALDLCCATFKKNAAGNWRFHFTDERGEVDTAVKQQELFLGCDGKVGSWTPIAKVRAKLWAACLANIWQDERARKVQVDFTIKRQMGFVSKEAYVILWDTKPDSGWVGALRAAFLSFAANNPTIASQQLQKAVAELKSQKWSPEWCTGVIKQMTFGPGIVIYPERYRKIRPWLESLWTGVTLPQTSDDLKVWVEPRSIVRPVTVEVPPNVDPPSPPPVITIFEEHPKPVAPEQPIVESQAVPKPGFIGLLFQLLQRLFSGRKQ